MRLDWLDDILAVAETGSLAAAAERRHLSPSAFSRRVAALEAQLGVELVDRSSRPLRLRPAAAAQRERMAALARELRRLGEDLRRGAAARRVTVAAQHALSAALAPPLLGAIAARHPGTQVRLRSANLAECVGLLLGGRADLALVYRDPGEPDPIRADLAESRLLGADRLVPVAAPGTGAGAAADGVGDLPLVAYPPDVFLGEVLERRILARLPEGRHPVVRAETALTLAALELAAGGLGIAWVPATLAAPALAAGRLADLSGALPSCALEIVALRLRGPRAALAAAVWDGLAAPA